MIKKIKDWMHWRGIEAKDLIYAFVTLTMLVSVPIMIIISLIYF